MDTDRLNCFQPEFPIALQGPFAAALLPEFQLAPALCEPALRFDLPVERFNCIYYSRIFPSCQEDG